MPGWGGLWHGEFLGNELGAWALALGVFLVTFTVLPLAKGFIAARRRRLSALQPHRQAYFAIELTTLLAARTNRLFLFGGGGLAGLARPHFRAAPRALADRRRWCGCSGCRWRCGP